MSERARGREIPSLVNTESRLDPNPAKWSGELTFPYRAAQQAFLVERDLHPMDAGLPYEGVFGSLLIFSVVWQDESPFPLSSFCFFSFSFLKESGYF